MAVSFDPRALSETAQQAKQQVTQRAWGKIPAETRDAMGQRISESSQNMTDSVGQAKARLGEQLSQQSDRAHQGLSGLTERAGTAAGDLIHHGQDFLTQPMRQWLEEHQAIAWATNHPIWAVLLLLILAILSLNLLKVVLNPRNWLKVLSLPFRLAQLGMGQESLSFDSSLQTGEVRQGEVNAILRRLEALNKEQEILHEQLKTLLSAQQTKS